MGRAILARIALSGKRLYSPFGEFGANCVCDKYCINSLETHWLNELSKKHAAMQVSLISLTPRPSKRLHDSNLAGSMRYDGTN